MDQFNTGSNPEKTVTPSFSPLKNNDSQGSICDSQSSVRMFYDDQQVRTI
jgi:hypothetical protein